MTPRFSRSARTWWSRWLIASLLFLQLTTAAYACAMHSTPSSDTSMAGMPCAQAMERSANGDRAAPDADQPGLCHEHCKGGSQVVDPATSGALPAPALVALFVVAAPVALTAEARGWRQGQVERDSAPPPPHALLHCCFRI